jgi:predicted kinase
MSVPDKPPPIIHDPDPHRASQRPCPTVVIITGPPASGKTTLARELARRLRLPLLSKDLFKETLFDQLGWSDREWSRRLGIASMALLFRSAGALLEAGQSILLESNFYAAMDTGPLLELADVYGCRYIQVVCSASAATLEQRYRQRSETGERHLGHTQSESLDETVSRLLAGRWDALDLTGPLIRVDTDAEVDVDTVISAIRHAMETPQRS